jgi:hypothetical protein
VLMILVVLITMMEMMTMLDSSTICSIASHIEQNRQVGYKRLWSHNTAYGVTQQHVAGTVEQITSLMLD